MRDLYTLRTADNVTFELELAGLASRAAGFAVDALAMALVLSLTSYLLSLAALVLGELMTAAQIVVGFVVVWWYGALAEWRFGGRTLGKHVVGMRVVSESGAPPTFTQCVTRNLLRAIDLLPLGFGVAAASCVLDRKGRRLGDLAAGTLVVMERPVVALGTFDTGGARADLDAIVTSGIGRRVDAATRDVMTRAILRRNRLEPHVRSQIFAALAAVLEDVGVPRPALATDERFVLLCATALGRSSPTSTSVP